MNAAPAHRTAGSLHDLADRRDQWNALAASTGLPMVRYEWFAAAEAHLVPRDAVRVVYCLDASGNLAAAAPLELRRGPCGRACFELMGMARLYEPAALLYRDSVSRRLLMRALAKLERPVVLARVRDLGAAAAGATTVKLATRAVWVDRPCAPSQHLELTGDHAGYLAGLPAQRRYDLRRAYRRAEQAGALDVSVTQPTPAVMEGELRRALEVEHRGWKGARGSSVLANPDLHGFYSDLLRSQAADGGVVIALLRVGGRPAAAQLCLLAHERLWLLKIGHDVAFDRLSPGLILMHELIRYAYGLGLQGIEFLGSAERWVDAWRPSLRQYRMLAGYPYNARSLAALARQSGAALLRPLRRPRPVHG